MVAMSAPFHVILSEICESISIKQKIGHSRNTVDKLDLCIQWSCARQRSLQSEVEPILCHVCDDCAAERELRLIDEDLRDGCGNGADKVQYGFVGVRWNRGLVEGERGGDYRISKLSVKRN